jgi:hypothetical protein
MVRSRASPCAVHVPTWAQLAQNLVKPEFGTLAQVVASAIRRSQ